MTTIERITKLESIEQISISETDCAHNVKPSVLFNCMQDLAARSIKKYGEEFSCDGLAKRGQGWFIIRYHIEFDNYPNHVEELKIKTESRGAQKLTAYRDFEVYNNSTGERLLRATSSWFIVNMENKSVVNIIQEYPEFLEYKKREGDLELKKLRPIDRIDIEKTFQVRYDDLDINNHVNNTVYITWAMETLDYEFRRSHKLKTLDIYFKHEAKYGEDVLSQAKFDFENLTSEHLIKNAQTGEEVCLLRAEYEK